MKTLNQTCVDLSISTDAFAKTLRAAMELHRAKLALSQALQEDFSDLRDEGITEEEEQQLKKALSFTIGQ